MRDQKGPNKPSNVSTSIQGRIKTLGAPCQRVVGALSSSPLPSPVLPSPLPSLPFPSLPSPPLPYLSPPLPSSPLEVGSLNTSRGSGERCKLPQWGLGRSSSRQTISCIFQRRRQWGGPGHPGPPE